MKELKEVGGIYFDKCTPDEVVNVLNDALISKKRVRLFYGDKKTGADWAEVNDTMGTIGKTTGKTPVLILLKNSTSIGGGHILDNCIVKITIDKNVVYQHPKYKLHVQRYYYGNIYRLINKTSYDVLFTLPTKMGAEHLLDFLEGTVNNIRYK